MSTGTQTAGHSRSTSTDGFTAIFEAAKKEYKKLTRKDLDTHRFAAQLDNCKSPEALSNVLQEQADAFNAFRERDEKLMSWLRPIVTVLSTLSGTIAQGVAIVSRLIRPRHDRFSISGFQTSQPAGTVVTGICVLLQVRPSVT
jgi:hypothetical protein